MNTFCKSSRYAEQVKSVLNTPIDWSYFKGKTFLISGATGMIGSFMIDVLAKCEGVKIIATSRNEEKAKERFKAYWGSPCFSFIEQDVNKPIKLECPINFIISAASNTHPIQYSKDPVGTIMTNITGTKNMLDLSVKQSDCRFMFLSSVEVYGENRGDINEFTESYCGYIDSNSLRAGYPESKRAGEALCQAYAHAYNIDVVIPRLSRVYGATMAKTDSKAIAQFISKSIYKEDIILKSAGDQLYSYTYVPDAVAGLLYILLHGVRGEAYNIASNGSHDISLKDLAHLLAQISGTKVIFEVPDESEKQGYSTATKALLNSNKLRALAWKPIYEIEEGLKHTINILREE